MKINKEQRAYLVLLAQREVVSGWDEATFARWSRHVVQFVINTVCPWMDEMAAGGCDMEFVRREMAEDCTDVCYLRFCGLISAQQARDLFDQSWACGNTWNALPTLRLADQATGDELLAIVRQVVAETPKAVADYRAGKVAAANSMIGLVVRKGKEVGRPVDAVTAKELILQVLADGLD